MHADRYVTVEDGVRLNPKKQGSIGLASKSELCYLIKKYNFWYKIIDSKNVFAYICFLAMYLIVDVHTPITS